jgi:HEAT repeat protein
MTDRPEIDFQALIEALLDFENPLPPRFLYRLSDLEAAELDQLKSTWLQLPLWRRQALMEDLETLGNADDLLSFEAVGKHAVTDEDPRVRQLGVQILWEFESRDLIRTFLDLVKTDPDGRVRAAAATALGRFVYLGELDEIPEEKLQTIEDGLIAAIQDDREPAVRRRALESISFSGREEIPPLIEAAFASGDKDWVATSLLAMGRSADERWNADVLKMLDNRTPRLRAEAARAAGELEISEAASQLFELVEDGDPDVRLAAIWSLSQIGGEGVRELLERLLEDSDEDEEADFLESALDNLAFTEGLDAFSLFDFPQKPLKSEVEKLLEDDEDYLDFADDEDEADEDEVDEDEFSDIADEDEIDEEENEDFLD